MAIILPPKTMRRFLFGLAAAATAASVPSASLAVTSGTVSASMQVGYACDLTLPGNQTLSINGTTATASADLPYTQNGSTIYQLSSLTLNAPNGATAEGTISVLDKEGGTLVTNSSQTASATGNANTGADAGSGSVSFSISEGEQSAFVEGAYSISATLTCSES